jgi:hypothetical protein
MKIPILPSLGDWLKRREMLIEHGVAVPQLHAVNRGVLIEEYIPHDFHSTFIAADAQSRAQLRQQFIETYKRVHKLGFRPISLHDARTRGQDVVLVDFGSDLGGILAKSYEYDAELAEQTAHVELRRLVE